MRAATILAMAAVLSAGATTARAAPLTLAEAVEKARAHAPGLKRLAALETAAAAGVAEARAGRRPTVDLSAAYTRMSHVPELSLPFPGGAPRVLVPDVPDNWRTRLGASIPLYTGGRLEALDAAARGARDAAAAETAVGEADLVLETSAAYWILATAREGARVLREGLAAYDQHLADARHREEQGVVPRSDALLVQVERDRAELALTRALFDAEVAEENLRRLTGIARDVPIEIAEPLESPARPEADVEDLVVRSLARRNERTVIAARRDALEAGARVEDAARRPHLGAAAAYDYARPNRQVFPVEDAWKRTWDVSLGASFQVFDGGRSRAAAERRRAEAEALARQIDDLDGRIRLEVVSRHLELRAAIDAVAVSERAVEAATEARAIVRDRYLEGVSTNGDYLDAEAAWLRAGLDRTGSVAQARVAAARLERAVGR